MYMPSRYIEKYSFGDIVIDGQTYKDDVVLLGKMVKSGWWRKEGHRLNIDDLQKVIDYGPDLLIIGTGNSGRMRVSSDIDEKVDFEIESYPTNKACKKYNLALDKDIKVAGAFHLTC